MASSLRARLDGGEGPVIRDLAWPLAAAAVVTVSALGFGSSLAAEPIAAPQAAPSPTALPTSGPLADGRFLYERDCAWCHGSQGQGTSFGVPLRGVGAASVHFMLTTGRMPILEPDDEPRRSEPSYPAADIERIAAYVERFFGGGPEIPEVDPASGSLGEGEVLYQENCAACHGSAGEGATLTSGQRASSILESTAIEIAEAIRIGGAGLRTGDMPRFGRGELTDSEVDAIIRYVLLLQERPPDAGGAALDHLGPVAEGFIAVFVALPLLLLFVRWIGKSSAEGG
jgi:ubiquinol-cytochrome c reductase cytochrome c subunit